VIDRTIGALKIGPDTRYGPTRSRSGRTLCADPFGGPLKPANRRRGASPSTDQCPHPTGYSGKGGGHQSGKSTSSASVQWTITP